MGLSLPMVPTLPTGKSYGVLARFENPVPLQVLDGVEILFADGVPNDVFPVALPQTKMCALGELAGVNDYNNPVLYAGKAAGP